MFPSGSKVEECRGLWWFLRLPTRHRQKCIVSGSFTGAPERWSIWNKKKGKHWWLLTLFQRVIASSSPSIDRRRVGSTYVFTFSKGPTEHQKIKMQFNPTGFSCQRLHCKLAPSQSLLFFCWMPFLEDTQSLPASGVIPSRELTAGKMIFLFHGYISSIPPGGYLHWTQHLLNPTFLQVTGSTGTEQVPTNWYTSIRALPFSYSIAKNVRRVCNLYWSVMVNSLLQNLARILLDEEGIHRYLMAFIH